MNETVNPHGNPQAKGLSWCFVLQRPRKFVQNLQMRRCSTTGARVLSCRAFKFRVAPDNTYYLYRVEGEWQLSLISPEEWGRRLPGDYVAECQLSRDMT